MARESVTHGTGMTQDERTAFAALLASYTAWRRAVEMEGEATAERVWRAALTLQGKPIPERPPSSPQDTGNIGAPPF